MSPGRFDADGDTPRGGLRTGRSLSEEALAYRSCGCFSQKIFDLTQVLPQEWLKRQTLRFRSKCEDVERNVGLEVLSPSIRESRVHKRRAEQQELFLDCSSRYCCKALYV